jgi:hypothetical protein
MEQPFVFRNITSAWFQKNLTYSSFIKKFSLKTVQPSFFRNHLEVIFPGMVKFPWHLNLFSVGANNFRKDIRLEQVKRKLIHSVSERESERERETGGKVAKWYITLSFNKVAWQSWLMRPSVILEIQVQILAIQKNTLWFCLCYIWIQIWRV